MTVRCLILIVEDDPDVRALMAEALDDAGFDVAEASDGWKALDVVGERQPALAIVDMTLPGIDWRGCGFRAGCYGGPTYSAGSGR